MDWFFYILFIISVLSYVEIDGFDNFIIEFRELKGYFYFKDIVSNNIYV